MNFSNFDVFVSAGVVGVSKTDAGAADAVLYGAWIDMARFTNWSLHVVNLESDGEIDLYVSNEPFQPAKNVQDTIAVKLNVNPIKSTSEIAHTFFQGGANTAHWMQVVKTNGATPLNTFVYIFGQLGAN
jgi:hypothetical protein